MLVMRDVWKSYRHYQGSRRKLPWPSFSRGSPLAWALRGVNLEARPGTCTGVIGANGAGKSTLLRVAAGLTPPTRGTVAASASPYAVLGLAELFDPALSARENAITSSMVAGMRRRAAEAALPAIFEFAELETHADAPVRTFSDGMKLRLAFGVISRLRPPILVVDEVFAVGDMAFRAKCIDYLHELRSEGSSLVLASHDLDQVISECDQAHWLDSGRIRYSGETKAVVDAYRNAMLTETIRRVTGESNPDSGGDERPRVGTHDADITDVTLSTALHTTGGSLAPGGSLSIALTIKPRHTCGAIVAVAIRRIRDGVVCCNCNTGTDRVALDLSRPTIVTLYLERLDLGAGEYAIEAGLYAPEWTHIYDFDPEAAVLTITGAPELGAVLSPPRRWSLSESDVI